MKLAVIGLWHLGMTTAACMAAAGFDVLGYDPDPAVVAGLNDARLPVFEPGMEDLVRAGLASGRLSFSADVKAVAQADVAWITFDTPVDDQDRADVASVVREVEAILPVLGQGVLVMISSQLPAGTIAGLERGLAKSRPGSGITFACVPERIYGWAKRSKPFHSRIAWSRGFAARPTGSASRPCWRRSRIASSGWRWSRRR